MTKQKQHKGKPFKFSEFGPIYLDRKGKEVTCEPSGVAYYTLNDFGCCDGPSFPFVHNVEVSDFFATDESGKTVKLTDAEKKKVCEEIIESLENNDDYRLS